MKIIQMATNHMINPIGYRLDKPIFSYKVIESVGSKQRNARIQVSLDEKMNCIILDTGVCESLDSLGYAAEIELLPRTRYYWNVEVMSDAGEICCSDIAFFETGKMTEPWEGRWICSELGKEVLLELRYWDMYFLIME